MSFCSVPPSTCTLERDLICIFGRLVARSLLCVGSLYSVCVNPGLSKWETSDRGITNPTLLPHVFTVTASIVRRCSIAGMRLMEAASYQQHHPFAHRHASPTARGNAAGLVLRAPLMNMYIHHEWLTCCFAYVQLLSSECRLLGPIGALRCLSKLLSLWSSIYLSRSWSAPQVGWHNELWGLIIFLRGGEEKVLKLGSGNMATSTRSCWSTH